MPAIIIKDYTWRQTEEYVTLNVTLSGHPKKVDLFAIDNYVKASFPPFIFELFLWDNIVEEKSTCVLTDREIILSLRKEKAGVHWPRIDLQDIGNEIKNEYRNRARERFQAISEERSKVKAEKRQILQKAAVKAQINIDTATLNRIDLMRDTHRKEAMKEFEDWRATAELPFLSNAESELQENRKAYRPPLKWFKDETDTVQVKELTSEEIMTKGMNITEVGTGEPSKSDDQETQAQKLLSNTATNNETVSSGTESNTKVSDAPITTELTQEGSSSEDSESDYEYSENRKIIKFYNENKKTQPGQKLVQKILTGQIVKKRSIFGEPTKSIPLPRRSGKIGVHFSERAFPTPARESSHLEEQEWLLKQAEAKRKTGFAAEDLRPEERDPQWLKNKGDEFYKIGNHLAAISAYTLGIKISDKMASLYVNRSAAQYALGNYFRCADDCTKALELMEPKCEANRLSRARCHARRGAALCKLSAPQHGIPELEAALKLEPQNESVKHDLLAAKQYFEIRE